MTKVVVLAYLAASLALAQLSTTKSSSGFMALLIVASVLLISRLKPGDALEGDSAPCRTNELLLLAAILLLACLPRCLSLGLWPYGVWFDEAENILVSSRIWSEPDYWPVFIPDRTQMAAFFFYLWAPFLAFFSDDVMALRLVCAISGIGAVVVTWLLTRELFGFRCALMAAFFLAVSRWHITFSRFGMVQISLTIFFPLVLLLFHRLFVYRTWRSALLAGAALGLSLQGYYGSAALLPVLALAFPLYWFLSPREQRRPGALTLSLFLLSATAVLSPLAEYAYSNWEEFSRRFRAVSEVHPAHLLDVARWFGGAELSTDGRTLLEVLRDYLLMFHFKGDRNGRHNLYGEPMLDPFTGACMLVGMLLAIRQMRQPKYAVLLLWFGAAMASGVFSVSAEAPNSGRTIALTPLVAIFAAQGALLISNALRSSTVRMVLTTLIAIATISWNLVQGLRQLSNYDSWLAYSTLTTYVGRALSKLPTHQPVFVPEDMINEPSLTLFAPKRAVLSYQSLSELLPPVGADRFTVMIPWSRFHMVAELLAIYPRAVITDFQSSNLVFNPGVFTALKQIEIGSEDIESYRTPRLSCLDQPGISAEGRNHQITWGEFHTRHNCPPLYSASLLIRDTKPVTVEVAGDAELSLQIDRHVLFSGRRSSLVTVILDAGQHLIQLVPGGPNPSGESRLAVRELHGGLPIELNSPIAYRGGLRGEYFSGSNLSGPVQMSRIDPIIDIHFHELPVRLPYSARWRGWIDIESPGTYRFSLESVNSAMLRIGSAPPLKQTVPSRPTYRTFTLERGRHPIEVNLETHSDHSQIHLLWSLPDSEAWVSVPAERLIPSRPEIHP